MLDRNVLQVEGKSTLKTIREDLLKMSQQELASALGIAVSTVSRWERGSGTPTFTPGQFKILLTRLAHQGISLEELPDDWGVQ